MAEQYLECLKEHLPLLMVSHEKVFMHNGASIHKAKIVHWWLEEQRYQVLEWPPYSLDLNLIEHLWKPVKEDVYLKTEFILAISGCGAATTGKHGQRCKPF